MKLLLDQGLPRSAANLLSESGVETIHVGDIGMAAATDEEILSRASVDGRVVVTLDSDFHALLALSASQRPSVVRIRIEGLRAKPLASLLLKVIDQVSDEIEKGAAVTVEPGRVRVRTLPLIK